jgi:nucleotide-binding universal stress UspA family protein
LAEVTCEGDAITIDGREIRVLGEHDLGALPWAQLNIDVVIEATGQAWGRSVTVVRTDTPPPWARMDSRRARATMRGPGRRSKAMARPKEHAMFNKIIVGVDGREGGRDALALAARLAGLFGGDLVAVYAYPYDLFARRGATSDLDGIRHDHAEDTLAGELERAGVEANAVALPDGSPGRALQLAAKRHHGDLIVVGSAHHGPIGRVLAGDVTMGTLHGARCPVVVAPRDYAERGSDVQAIGVGLDGSPEAGAAVELSHALAVAANASLKVIRVLQPGAPGGAAFTYRPDWAEREQERRDEAQEQLDAVVAELGEIATGELVVGDPATELAYAGNELDLLVTGSRGYGPARRLMLGSTSTRLVRSAPCPVLVLTRGAEADTEDAPAPAAMATAPTT